MNWLTRAELRFGHLGIPGLPAVIVGLNLLFYALIKVKPEFADLLLLDLSRLAHGEVWRLFTFLFIPSWGGDSLEFFSLFLYLAYIFFIGFALERAMGAFKLTLFYALLMIAMMVGATVFADPSAPTAGLHGGSILNGALLFAFVLYSPDAQFMIGYFIPVKAKYVAWVSAVFLLIRFLAGPGEFRASLLLGIGVYCSFFAQDLAHAVREGWKRQKRRHQFDRDIRLSNASTLHHCAVCGRSETTPDLEFRVSRDGQEYCLDHLPKPAASA